VRAGDESSARRRMRDVGPARNGMCFRYLIGIAAALSLIAGCGGSQLESPSEGARDGLLTRSLEGEEG